MAAQEALVKENMALQERLTRMETMMSTMMASK